MSSKRKPYTPPMTATWWKANEFYKLYILRESTALFSLWFSFELLIFVKYLMKGVKALDGFDGFFSNPFGDLNDFITGFLHNPVVMLINFIALLMALLNTVTYFNMTPKVMPLTCKGNPVKAKNITIAMWVVTAIVSALVLFYFA